MRLSLRTAVVILSLAWGFGEPARAQDGPRTSIRVVGWNVQSDFTPNQQESDPDLLRKQMAQKQGVHIWGLAEVLNAQALAKFEQGAEEGEDADFASILGTT